MNALVTAAMVAVLAATATPAGAGPATLRAPGQRIEWVGSFAGPTACPDTCAETVVDVAVRDSRAGVQFGVHWPDPAGDLNLWVYDGAGALVAFSARPDGDTESVLLPGPVTGRYRVVVGAAAARDTGYTAWAEIEPGLDPDPVRDLLPNLVPQAPSDVGLPVVDVTGSCYADEVAESGARRCLRFDQTVANFGEGSLELRFRPGALGVLAGRAVAQRIRRSDGSAYERPAGFWEYHATHQHFHVTAFAESRLWRAGPDGRRLGAAPLRTGRKNGFCLVDLFNFWWGRSGDGPRTYVACEEITGMRDPFRVAVTGISAGWADRYGPRVPGQYVDVTGVPDGYYVLETVADPAGTVAESDESDNSVTVLIELRGDEAGIHTGDVRPGEE